MFIKKNTSKISVVSGSYNRLPFLKLMIESVRNELKDFNYEIIIVDGGSDDGTLQWLLSQKDIITIVQHNRGKWNGKQIERKSWGYFMNLAFKCAHGKYVCMLSDDCLVIPGAIKNGYNLFEQELSTGRKIGAVAFYFRDWSKDDNRYYVGYTLGNKLYVNHGIYLKKALEDVNYIDESTYFFYNGDGDLALKIWQKGYECIPSEGSYIEHYPHANLGVIKSNHKKQNKDNKSYFEKWEGIFYNKKKHNIGKSECKVFKDQFLTGNKFINVHQNISAENPEILVKKKNITLRSYLGSLRRKFVNFLNKYLIEFIFCFL
ncbi:glycosyltransferase [Candidatus Dependentiae bacterium]|nr:glycosyltransferase [Candidatus Dependentiae bacterium]